MSDLGAIGGVVIAVSACTSGLCIAVAYHIPAKLRGGFEFFGDAIFQIEVSDEEPSFDPPKGD